MFNDNQFNMINLQSIRMKSVIIISLVLFFVSSSIQAQEEKPKAARSVHLWFPAPDGSIYYNEVTVKESHPGTYFSVCGFRHGYFGIQEIRSPEDKVVIFSVWDPGKQNDPNSVEEDRRVKVLHNGEGVRISRFGNEGTGGKSMFPYQWKVDETYKCLVHAKVDGEHTTYSAYFFLNESQAWKHLASFQTTTGGEYLKGYYCFVEDFRRNGLSATQVRNAEYGGGWVKTVDGDWVSLSRARFTADNTPTLNIDAGITTALRFFLQTGGDTQNHTQLRSELTIPPSGLILPEGLK